jgi:subtilisin family serine protease
VAYVDGTIRPGNGTSFSGPVITGLAACLWQANPDAKAMEIYNSICESADRFYHPNNDYGYGVPDFNLANILLKASQQGPEDAGSIKVFPNPFNNQLYIFFESSVNESVDVILYDLAGKEIFHKTYPEVSGKKYMIIDSDFESIQNGVYIIRIETGDVSRNSKLIKF